MRFPHRFPQTQEDCMRATLKLGLTATVTGLLLGAAVVAADAGTTPGDVPAGVPGPARPVLAGNGLKRAQLLGGNLLLTNVSNVIVRNVTFVDAHDCFPAWTPTDGADGNWNSLYDNITLSGTTNVWIDHDTFTDGANQDVDQPR